MFTHTAVRGAVTRAREGEVATITRVERGNDHSYRVTFRDGRDLFLKVGTRFSEAFPAEPKTMRVVRSETSVPVPGVHATGTEPLGYPFAVYDYVAGAGDDRIGDLPRAAAERLCREAGEHLAELHRIAFPEFGRVGVEDDALAVVEPRPYRDLLRGSLDRQLAALADTPFADRRGPLESLGTGLLDRIDFDSIRPALVHGDYRLDNLRVDPAGERVTAAVLDWELPTAADPLWDAAMAVTLLTEGCGTDSDDRRTFRVAFWDGYGDRPAATARWRYYELLGRIRLARHLGTEMRGRSGSAVSERVDEHLDAFDELLDGRSHLRSTPTAR